MDNEKREYNTATKQWLSQAEFLSLNAGLGYIDVIIDQAGSDKPVVDALKQLSPTACYGLLFEETPEEGMVNDSPVLVRLFWSEWQHRARASARADRPWHFNRYSQITSASRTRSRSTST